MKRTLVGHPPGFDGTTAISRPAQRHQAVRGHLYGGYGLGNQVRATRRFPRLLAIKPGNCVEVEPWANGTVRVAHVHLPWGRPANERSGLGSGGAERRRPDHCSALAPSPKPGASLGGALKDALTGAGENETGAFILPDSTLRLVAAAQVAKMHLSGTRIICDGTVEENMKVRLRVLLDAVR